MPRPCLAVLVGAPVVEIFEGALEPRVILSSFAKAGLKSAGNHRAGKLF